jgi:multidrug resistance efflux pump
MRDLTLPAALRPSIDARLRILIFSALVILVSVVASAVALAAEGSKAGPNPDSPTHTVKRGIIKNRVQLDAVFESAQMHPVRIQTKGIPELTVVSAVAHGAHVKKGDVLVKVELDKLREQLEDLEQDRPASTLTLELAEAELANLIQTTPAKQEAAKRAQRIAAEDLAYFENIGRASRKKGVEFNIKGSEQRLEGAREELKQLQKMYAADDLTEESEEIILKRQKHAVEAAEFYHETSRQAADLTLKTTLPREADSLKTVKRDQELAAAYAEETLQRTLAKKRLDVEKLKRDQKKAEKRLAELKGDLEELTITAPSDGLVYYGACEDGKWTTGAAVAKRLIPGGKIAAREVIMTVVHPDKLVLRATVPEADVARLKTGQEGQAAPVASPDRKVSVKLESLGFVPLPGGGFAAQCSIGRANGVRLMPGMNCKITFDGSRSGEVLIVPKEAVFPEGADRFVYLAERGGAPEKRAVKTGGTDDKNIEIEEGLSAGDVVLGKKPE